MVKTYQAGELIFSDGSQGSEMYIVQSGSVRVFKLINGEKIELSIIGKGNFFGEMSILLEPTRHASVEAIENTELLALNKQALVEKIKTDPLFVLNMLITLAKRETEAHKIIAKLEGIKKSYQVMYGAKQ